MRIHFIGIGGIGVSALAQYYLAQGHKVSGSDLASSETIELLKKKGAVIFVGGHKPEHLYLSRLSCLKWHFKHKEHKCRGVSSSYWPDLVIYSPAVSPDNPELKRAHKIQDTKYKIQISSYPEALGELTKKYFTIAVAGTHGKSTTTAMIALILVKAGLDPTVILGTKLKELKEFPDNTFPAIAGNVLSGAGSNFRMGRSQYFVIEADEHRASFLHYWPKMIVLTNIEEDHLDYYKNLGNIKKAFRKFVSHLPGDGALVVNADDRNSKIKIQKPKLPQVAEQSSLRGRQFKIKNYSLLQKEAEKLRKLLRVPGEHNVSNALAALTAARALKIPDRISFKALSEYRGAWRRFEIKRFKIKDLRFKVVSDYAHHPTEIRATLQAAREKFPGKKIWAVFQPHQTARTVALFHDFIKAFDEADAVVLTKIFEVAGREPHTIASGELRGKEKNARALAAKIKKRKKEAYFVADFKKIPAFLKNKAKKGDVILIMGAGDIYLIASSEHWKS